MTRRRKPKSTLAVPTRGWRGLFVLVTAVAVLATGAIGAQVVPSAQASGDAPPNFDIRTYKNDPRLADDAAAAAFLSRVEPSAVRMPSTQVASRVAGLARLRAALGDVTVESQATLGTAETVSMNAAGPFLTRPAVDRVAALRGFLQTYSAAYGITLTDVQTLAVVADYLNPDGNMAWVELEQRVNGLPVFQGLVRGGFTAKGQLVRTTGLLAAGAAAAPVAPVIDAAQAVSLAAESAGWTLNGSDLTEQASAAGGARIIFNRTAVAEDIKAWQVYFPLSPGVLRLAWATEIMGSPDAFLTLIDAETGALLFRKNLTNYQTQAATYVVCTGESPAPATPTPAVPGANYQAPPVGRQSITLIGNEAPNTFNALGWITDGTSVTDGNNVQAGLDIDGVNGVDAPVAGASRVFDFTYNPGPGSPAPGDAPTTGGFRNGEVTNMFYWVNRFHDETYRLGFTEAARNFQDNNFGRGGLGSDRISAEAQDSFGANNANFATPADGGRGRMQMFVFTGATPDRSSGLDQTVLVHELAHGLSNRLHSNGAGLNAAMSAGMGEGWSDFYARALTSSGAEPVGGIFTTGGWVTHGLFSPSFSDNYYYGIRRFPYAVKTTTGGAFNRPHNPLTFADIDPAQINLSDGAYPANPALTSALNAFEVHNSGEVWAMALLEVRARFIARLGYTAGNQRVLQLVTDGMKLDPVNPTMVQGRDAILAAAAAGSNPVEDSADIWAGFATRGLGMLAVAPSASSGSVTESFLVPGDPVPTFTVNDAAASEGDAGVTQIAFTVSLANPSAVEHRVSFATADTTALALGTPFGAAVPTAVPAGAPGATAGPASPYPVMLNVAGVTGPIQHLAVQLSGLTHTYPSDLDVLLVGPAGQRVMLLSDVGGSGNVAGLDLVVDDGGAAPSATQLVPGIFAPTDLSPGDVMSVPAPAGPYGTALSAFNGTNPNGLWRLYVMDDVAGDSGSLAGFTLFLSTPGSAPDYTFATGQLIFPPGATTRTVTVSVMGDLTPEAHETFFVNLSAPVNAVIGDAQGIGTILNDDAGGAVLPPTAVADAYAVTASTLVVAVPGVLANDTTPSGALTAQLVTTTAHGALTFAADGGFTYTPVPGYTGPDSFTYRPVGSGGSGNTVTAVLAVSIPLAIQPPTGLRVASMAGSTVTLRWTPPAIGPVATGYLLEAGLAPGDVLGTMPLGPVPSFTVEVPTGSFYVRVRASGGGNTSAVSNEIPLHVNVPVPPSAPAHLLGTVAGSSLTLAWTNTFSGGAPTGLFLDVNGAVNGTLPIGPADTFSLDGVPAGVYTLSLRAANAAGTSASSNPVTLTFPGGCSGAPLPPADFLAFDGGGNMLSLAWDAAAAGAAPSGFVLAVTGSFMGSVPVSGRRLNAAVPSGAYGLRLQAVNACGASAFSPVQTVVIP